MQKYALQMAKVNLTYAKFVGGGICGRNERQQGSLCGVHPLCSALSQQRLLDSIKPVYNHCGRTASSYLLPVPLLTVGQYASNPSHRTYCFAELAVSFLVAVAKTITSTRCACRRRNGQDYELIWVAGYLPR